MFLRIAFTALAAGVFLGSQSVAHADDDSPKVKRVIVKHPESGKAREASQSDEVGIFIVDDGDDGPHLPRHTVDDDAPGGKETYLGVVTEPAPAILAAQMPKLLAKNQGLVITKVLDDSPAAKCGLRTNDVLATVGEHKVVSSDQLKKLISSERPGAKVELGIVRGGEAMKLSATLEERRVSVFAFQPLKLDGKNQREKIEALRDKAAAKVAASKALREEVLKKAKPRIETSDARSRKSADAAKHSRISIQRLTESRSGDSQSPRNIAITVTIKDDADPRVSVDYTDENGKQIKRDFVGKLDEIQGKLDDLPMELREKIRQAMKNISIESRDAVKKGIGGKKSSGPGSNPGKSAILNLITDDEIMLLEPVEGKGVFSIKLGRPDGSATLKAIDFDIDVELDDVLKQVEDIGPEVKAQIRKSLEAVKLPRLNVAVEKSQ